MRSGVPQTEITNSPCIRSMYIFPKPSHWGCSTDILTKYRNTTKKVSIFILKTQNIGNKIYGKLHKAYERNIKLVNIPELTNVILY